jgi:hypothetical protein
MSADGTVFVVANNIFALGDRLKMVRVATISVCASFVSNVVEIQPFGNWPDEKLINNPVNTDKFAVDANDSVPRLIEAPRPKPAGFSLNNVGPKTRLDRQWFASAHMSDFITSQEAFAV